MSSPSGTFSATARYCSAAVRGRKTPACRYANCVSPEQSQLSGPEPPYAYGLPSCVSAAAIAASAMRRGGSLGRALGLKLSLELGLERTDLSSGGVQRRLLLSQRLLNLRLGGGCGGEQVRVLLNQCRHCGGGGVQLSAAALDDLQCTSVTSGENRDVVQAGEDLRGVPAAQHGRVHPERPAGHVQRTDPADKSRLRRIER